MQRRCGLYGIHVVHVRTHGLRDRLGIRYGHGGVIGVHVAGGLCLDLRIVCGRGLNLRILHLVDGVIVGCVLPSAVLFPIVVLQRVVIGAVEHFSQTCVFRMGCNKVRPADPEVKERVRKLIRNIGLDRHICSRVEKLKRRVMLDHVVPEDRAVDHGHFVLVVVQIGKLRPALVRVLFVIRIFLSEQIERIKQFPLSHHCRRLLPHYLRRQCPYLPHFRRFLRLA